MRLNQLINLRSAIFADLETIYHEFAAGNKDPYGNKNLFAMDPRKVAIPVPNFLLLLGDSGYDYRNINGYQR